MINYIVEIEDNINPLEYILPEGFNESSTDNNIPQDIIDFNKELNKYEYGILGF